MRITSMLLDPSSLGCSHTEDTQKMTLVSTPSLGLAWLRLEGVSQTPPKGKARQNCQALSLRSPLPAPPVF